MTLLTLQEAAVITMHRGMRIVWLGLIWIETEIDHDSTLRLSSLDSESKDGSHVAVDRSADT